MSHALSDTFGAAARRESGPEAGPRLHAYLRAVTQEAHDRVEARFAPFEADPGAHLAAFLRAQHAAFAALAVLRIGAPHPAEGDLATRLLGALHHDIDAASPPPLRPRARLDTLAVGYLTLGARLGASLLARKLDAAGCERPRFFAETLAPGQWAAFRQALDAVSMASPRAARIARDARIGFDIFAEAGARAFTTKDTPCHGTPADARA